MKKIFSLVLALVMCLSTTVISYATVSQKEDSSNFPAIFREQSINLNDKDMYFGYLGSDQFWNLDGKDAFAWVWDYDLKSIQEKVNSGDFMFDLAGLYAVAEGSMLKFEVVYSKDYGESYEFLTTRNGAELNGYNSMSIKEIEIPKYTTNIRIFFIASVKDPSKGLLKAKVSNAVFQIYSKYGEKFDLDTFIDQFKGIPAVAPVHDYEYIKNTYLDDRHITNIQKKALYNKEDKLYIPLEPISIKTEEINSFAWNYDIDLYQYRGFIDFGKVVFDTGATFLNFNNAKINFEIWYSEDQGKNYYDIDKQEVSSEGSPGFVNVRLPQTATNLKIYFELIPVENYKDAIDFIGADIPNIGVILRLEEFSIKKLSLPDGSTYEGEVDKDMIPYGMGIMHFPDGSVYQGNFEAGKIYGTGRMTYADGTIYAGRFRDNYPHGLGSMVYPDGLLLDGSWNNGEMNGDGRVYMPNKGVYKGYFENGEVYSGEFTDIYGNKSYGEFDELLAEYSNSSSLTYEYVNNSDDELSDYSDNISLENGKELTKNYVDHVKDEKDIYGNRTEKAKKARKVGKVIKYVEIAEGVDQLMKGKNITDVAVETIVPEEVMGIFGTNHEKLANGIKKEANKAIKSVIGQEGFDTATEVIGVTRDAINIVWDPVSDAVETVTREVGKEIEKVGGTIGNAIESLFNSNDGDIPNYESEPHFGVPQEPSINDFFNN